MRLHISWCKQALQSCSRYIPLSGCPLLFPQSFEEDTPVLQPRGLCVWWTLLHQELVGKAELWVCKPRDYLPHESLPQALQGAALPSPSPSPSAGTCSPLSDRGPATAPGCPWCCNLGQCKITWDTNPATDSRMLCLDVFSDVFRAFEMRLDLAQPSAHTDWECCLEISHPNIWKDREGFAFLVFFSNIP